MGALPIRQSRNYEFWTAGLIFIKLGNNVVIEAAYQPGSPQCMWGGGGG